MTREEEIKREALSNSNDIASEVDYKSTAAYEGFIKGAIWADKAMIDKACEWLRNYNTGVRGEEFINEFREAMKGE